MGWNGSDVSGGNGRPKEANSSSKKSATLSGIGASRGLLAGFLVVIGAGIAAWFLLCKSDAPAPSPEKVVKPEKRVVPAKARPLSPEKSAVTNVVEKKPETELKTYIDERGIKRYEGGLRVIKKIVQPPQDQMNINGPHLFENHAEHEILGLLTTEPGTFIIDVKYDKRRFEKAFVESLKHKIEILPDDSEDVKAQKLAVIDAKKSLEAAYKRGEDVTQIMNESRKELIKLNRYRDSLLETAAEGLSKDGTTEKDLDDYINAMNQMLRENGIREIQHKELARGVLMYQRKSAAKKAAQEKKQ